MLAPKSANALLTVVVLIMQGRMKLPGSFSLGFLQVALKCVHEEMLSNHLLPTPTKVRGNTHKRVESFVLNKLATSSTFLICSTAFSVELSEKIQKKYRCCELEQAKCLFWLETVYQDWRME
uniref:Uncharacterized protein n=1 Tax=Tanacetum cinerariifolium TaxID=118510 RepID=A0A6L2KFA5_TANCI|nr:hypothetical protein [Tanacetum cinerariifolium]